MPGVTLAMTATAIVALGLLLQQSVNGAARVGRRIDRRRWLAAILVAAALLIAWSAIYLPRIVGSSGGEIDIALWPRGVIAAIAPAGLALLAACAFLVHAAGDRPTGRAKAPTVGRIVYWTCLAGLVFMLPVYAANCFFLLLYGTMN
jgi:hypothetical protein